MVRLLQACEGGVRFWDEEGRLKAGLVVVGSMGRRGSGCVGGATSVEWSC